jgi:hypothetical protein
MHNSWFSWFSRFLTTKLHGATIQKTTASMKLLIHYESVTNVPWHRIATVLCNHIFLPSKPLESNPWHLDGRHYDVLMYFKIMYMKE